MHTLIWTAQAAIAEQRISDLQSQAAADRLAGQARGRAGRRGPDLTDLGRARGRRLSAGLHIRRRTAQPAARIHTPKELIVTEQADRTPAAAPPSPLTPTR
jgi:hypothetical protein